jgi:hypothetical protein
VRVKILLKTRCDELGICEYVEVPIARAARLIDRVGVEGLYIVVEDVDERILAEGI